MLLRPRLLILVLALGGAGCGDPDAQPVPREQEPLDAALEMGGADGGSGGVGLDAALVALPDAGRADAGRADAAPVDAGPPPAPVTLVGAGDVSWCPDSDDAATAALLDGIPGTIFIAGDASNDQGTASNYTDCFGATWGRHKARIRPAPGNHDYTDATTMGAAYHDYFGLSAGPAGKGWYSYDHGAWHVVVLNSECNLVDCRAGGEQERWLRADLAAHPSRCTLAVFHRPQFAPRIPGGSSYTRALWTALHEAGVELALVGHYHWYERYKPQDAFGNVRADGVRQFTVGTGGALYMTNADGWPANSEVHFDNVFGVLELTLRADGYDWRFHPEPGKQAFGDSGSDVCH